MECYEEIKEYERENNAYFDYIFHASGTGTTQTGLICGQLIERDVRKIVGISIARKNPRGRDIVTASVNEYLQANNVQISSDEIENATIFIDDYIDDGYGIADKKIKNTIENCMYRFGIPLDETYTGKAYYGMLEYLRKNNIRDRNILFIHTGGTPLFFDWLKEE